MQKLFSKINLVWCIIIVAFLLLVDTLIGTGIITSSGELTLVTIMINIILAVGLNLVIGISGQFSLGHAGFMAIGAYAGALVNMQVDGIVGLLLGMAVGIVVSSIVAIVVGVPTLKLTGDYLAIATLGTSEIIRIIISTSDGITQGASGISNIPNNVTWSIIYIFVILTTILILNYIRSSSGRATLAIRENEIAAQAMGVNTLKYKVIAFVIGAATASIAGTLHASYIQVITPGDFTFQNSIDILIIVVFGGIGSITGSIISAIVLGLINVSLQFMGVWRTIIYAIALLVIMIFKPSGLLGTKELMLSKWIPRLKKSE